MMLREVAVHEAIGHSLWEAEQCLDNDNYCACLAMLRKAIDLWSVHCRDEYAITFDESRSEKDNLYWRLRKIAEANKIYSESIHPIIDALRLDANDAVHNNCICNGGMSFGGRGAISGAMIAQGIKQPFVEVFQAVYKLITSTMRDVIVRP